MQKLKPGRWTNDINISINILLKECSTKKFNYATFTYRVFKANLPIGVLAIAASLVGIGLQFITESS